MSSPLYITTERFDPAKGAQWDHYVAWSGLSQLREAVTLDAVLCPRVINEKLLLHDSRFQFEGYDLVDVRGGISALTNCGGSRSRSTMSSCLPSASSHLWSGRRLFKGR